VSGVRALLGRSREILRLGSNVIFLVMGGLVVRCLALRMIIFRDVGVVLIMLLSSGTRSLWFVGPGSSLQSLSMLICSLRSLLSLESLGSLILVSTSAGSFVARGGGNLGLMPSLLVGLLSCSRRFAHLGHSNWSLCNSNFRLMIHDVRETSWRGSLGLNSPDGLLGSSGDDYAWLRRRRSRLGS
jgi:hypothetical protein